jgi:hypothetical protein
MSRIYMGGKSQQIYNWCEEWKKENLDIIEGLNPEKFRQWFIEYCYPLKDYILHLEEMCRKIKNRLKGQRFFDKRELREIISWKLAFDPRLQRKNLDRYDKKETAETIRDKTRVLFDQDISVEEKVHRVAGHGGGRVCSQCRKIKIVSVGVPVASTILRFIEPSEYPIIDQRVMDALHRLGFRGLPERKRWGNQPPQYRLEPSDYACYVELIKEISKKVKLLPSQVDMALWQSEAMCKRVN